MESRNRALTTGISSRSATIRCFCSTVRETVWWQIPQSGAGNVHSADGWEEILLPEIERQRQNGKEVVFRADAAFAKPEIYEALEERGVKYAIRFPANENLERDIEELLTRPVGRPSSGSRNASWRSVGPAVLAIVSEGMKRVCG